jgi:hypothetical protein
MLKNQNNKCFMTNCKCRSKLECDHDHNVVASIKAVQLITKRKIQENKDFQPTIVQKKRISTTNRINLSHKTKSEMKKSLRCILCKDHNISLSEDKDIEYYRKIKNFMMRESTIQIRKPIR